LVGFGADLGRLPWLTWLRLQAGPATG